MLQVTGSVVLGDGVSEAVIHNTDFIESSVRIMVPLSLTFSTQSVKTEIDTIKVDEDAQKELQKNLLSGKLYAKIENHLPLGCQVALHFSSLDTNVYAQPQLTIGPLILAPAPVSAGNGRVTQEAESEISIELTQEQIALFGHENVFMGVSATIPGSDGQSCQIFADDYIGVHAYGEFKYHVDPDDQSKK